MALNLPTLRTPADVGEASGAILAAVTTGEITLGEAAELARLVASHVAALESAERYETEEFIFPRRVARCAGLLAQRTTIDSRPYRRSRIGIRNELKLVNLVLGLRVVLLPPPQASIILMTEGSVNPPSKIYSISSPGFA